MRDRILEIISEQIDIPVEKINSDDTLNDLGIDSLDAIEIIMAIEEEYNLQLSEDERIENSLTIKEVIDFMEQLIQANS